MGRQIVKVRADFDVDGNPFPLKFKIVTEEKNLVTVRVDRITKSDTNFYAGNKMLVYHCESIEDGVFKPYELRYEVDTCKWFFYY
ncbi:MAG: hypothetical protein PHC45_00335 [Clostridiaceae bacterium]|nr:hypothetical protein [Clostridiaceae bacterium]